MGIRIKVLNKYFALIDYGTGAPRIEPNPFEMAKQYCILDAEKSNLPLPRVGYGVDRFEDDYPDLASWFCALTYQNPPSKLNYRANPKRFRELVEPLDFSRPYNGELVAKIKEEFIGTFIKSQVSAEDLVNAELEL